MQLINLYRFPGRGMEESGKGSSSGNREQQQPDDINVSNPQRGDDWNNYQTRELSSETEGNISEEEIREAFEDEDE